MLQEIALCVENQESFAFETTLSGLAYLKHISKWRALGYHVSLYFLALPTADLALKRVRERVIQGGHNIPEDVIRRRFVSGLANFELHYRFAVNAWAYFDNAGNEPIMIRWEAQNDTR